MPRYILALDQGTTGSTALVVAFTDEGPAKVVAKGYCEFAQHFPKPGWVEHDLNEIWESVADSARQALAKADIKPEQVGAIGITNQRETIGAWSVDGGPMGTALVWQDRRTADVCQKLREAGHEPTVTQKTGLVLDPYFSGTKAGWLLGNRPDIAAAAEKQTLRLGTMDAWLIDRLSGGDAFVTEVSNASRTLLFDINTLAWDDSLLELFGSIPRGALPEVRPSAGLFGKTRGLAFLPDGIPVSGVAGDQQAALFGQACFEPGMAKCTYGTGAFALVNVGAKPVQSAHRLLSTVAWQIGSETTYAIEGSTFVAGAAVQWLRDGLGIIEKSSDIEALAREVDSTDGVHFVPALTGLGAPYWLPEARGVITGLSRGTTRAHLGRAALEGIAFQIAALFGAMEKDSGASIKALRVDGGAANNDLLMQIQANLLGVEIHRPEVVETTALGAALLAALGVGWYSDLAEASSGWQLERAFTTEKSQAWSDEQMAGWQKAVAKA